MIPVEIERKFTIKYLPRQIESVKRISQKHIFKDMVCSIRVRKTEELKTKKKRYTHTIKARGQNIDKYSIYELEKDITEEEFNKMSPFKGSKIVEKYRCIIPLENNLKAEIDIFDGWMRGLVIAEVEFENVEQAENFKMPAWFENPVPHREFSNRKLSTKSREEILNMVGRGQLRVNERIYKELRRNQIIPLENRDLKKNI